MQSLIAIIITISMKGSPNYKVQIVHPSCDVDYATKFAEKLTSRANGKVKSVECRKLRRR